MFVNDESYVMRYDYLVMLHCHAVISHYRARVFNAHDTRIYL